MTGEVRDGLIDCLEHMVSSESEQLEIHRQITSFTRATGTFDKNLAKISLGMWMSQVTIPKFKVQVFKFCILYNLLLQGTNSTNYVFCSKLVGVIWQPMSSISKVCN
jgi:hypothetical protein